jgi:hypothetical protein
MIAFRRSGLRGFVLVLGVVFALPDASYAHVVLDDPNGGEVLETGSTFTVTWHIAISHALQNWDLWYSTTGSGGPWIVIATNLPPGSNAVGSVHTYDWTIPDALSTQVRVRVRMDNSGTDYYDFSNADLTITRPGDFNADADVDLDDFRIVDACLNGPDVATPPVGCSPANFADADLDGDNDVDLRDVDTFWVNFTG